MAWRLGGRGPLHCKAILIWTVLLSVPTAAWTDLYRVCGADGSTLLTDSPTQTGAILLSREHRPAETVRPAAAADRDGPRLPVPGKITSKVGFRHDPVDGRIRHHGGVDIAVPAGTEVRPVGAGWVSYSGYRGGYGNLVILEHSNGAVSLYAHNARNLVSSGEPVEAGQVIALAGSTGKSTGPHLHFEIWKDGTNYTSEYLRNTHPAELLPEGAGEDPIRKILLADGTPLFTNVPVR